MVFDQKDPFRLPLRHNGQNCGGTLSIGFFTGLEDHCELRTLITTGAFQSDASLMGLDQRFADCEPKPQVAQLRPTALLECVEDLWQRFRLNPRAVLGNLYSQLGIDIIVLCNRTLPVTE